VELIGLELWLDGEHLGVADLDAAGVAAVVGFGVDGEPGPASTSTCWSPLNRAASRSFCNGPTEAISGRLEHLRGSALGFRNLTNYIARSLLETGGFRPRLHPRL